MLLPSVPRVTECWCVSGMTLLGARGKAGALEWRGPNSNEEMAAMKRVTCALSILILGAQAAMAADAPAPPPGGPPRGGPSIERLAQDLNLDETQKTQVKR